MPRYIDADELLRKPPDIHDYYDESGEKDCAHGYTIATIKSAPTLSPDEVRGVVKVNYEHGDYSCSACGHPARRLSFARKKYCDECGAKLLWEVSEDA